MRNSSAQTALRFLKLKLLLKQCRPPPVFWGGGQTLSRTAYVHCGEIVSPIHPAKKFLPEHAFARTGNFFCFLSLAVSENFWVLTLLKSKPRLNHFYKKRHRTLPSAEIISSLFSMPIDRRIKSEDTPADRRSRSPSCECEVLAGCSIRLLASPTLARLLNSGILSTISTEMKTTMTMSPIHIYILHYTGLPLM